MSPPSASSAAPRPDFQVDRFDLPLHGPTSPEFRELIRFFLQDVFYIATWIYMPPINVETLLQERFQIILTNEIRAITALAIAKFHIMAATGNSEGDNVTGMIYSLVTSILRRRLATVERAQVEDLLLCVMSLANLDIGLGRYDTCLTHQRAIKQLVSAKGVVHNLGHSLVFLGTMDSRLAISTRTAPMYATQRMLQLPDRPPGRYGAAFYTMSPTEAGVSFDVLRFCRDECRLIELFEKSKMSFDTDNPSRGDIKMLPYFSYLRDQLAGEFAVLHARYHPENSGEDELIDDDERCRNWCVLVAAKIVEYPIVHGNLVRVTTVFMVDELVRCLQSQQSTELWRDRNDALTWILWVLATAPVRLDARIWAEKTLIEAIVRKHEVRADYAPHWAVLEWDGCGRWVWASDTTGLRKRCDDLIGNIRAKNAW